MWKDPLMYFVMFIWPLSSLQGYEIGISLSLMGKEYPVVLPIMESPGMCYVLIGLGTYLMLANLRANEFDAKSKALAMRLTKPLVTILQKYRGDVEELKKGERR